MMLFRCLDGMDGWDGWMMFFVRIDDDFYGWMNDMFWKDRCCILDGRMMYFGWKDPLPCGGAPGQREPWLEKHPSLSWSP